MRPAKDRMILMFILTIISVATILCLIALTTPGWNGHSVFSLAGLSAGLCILSLVLLIVCAVMAGIILSGIIVNERLPLIFISLLIISSIFMLAAFTSFFSSIYNYSYSLMVAAFTFTYLSSIIATYWLFGIHNTNEKLMISSKSPRPKLDILT
jgi:hypothetical protein